MSPLQSPHLILKRFLERKKRKNRAYSMRALARSVRVSPSYLSGLLKGTRPIPLERLNDLCDALDVDDVGRDLLGKAILAGYLGGRKALRQLIQSHSRAPVGAPVNAAGSANSSSGLDAPSSSFLEARDNDSWILNRWYHTAILDLATCADFQSSPKWIAKKLGITEIQAKDAVTQLLAAKLLVEKDGKWAKTSRNLRFPSPRTNPHLRSFHKQMMQKATSLMMSRTGEDDYRRRLIIGATVAANPEKIEEARRMLNETLFKVMEHISEGDCTEVYSIGIQLTPLT